MRSFALALAVPALVVAACVIPPGAATLPSSGVAGQPRARMTSDRTKGENPFKDAYWVLDPESNARRTADQWRATRPEDAAAMEKIAGPAGRRPGWGTGSRRSRWR